jgi:hypothetical protein
MAPSWGAICSTGIARADTPTALAAIATVAAKTNLLIRLLLTVDVTLPLEHGIGAG